MILVKLVDLAKVCQLIPPQRLAKQIRLMAHKLKEKKHG
jgi:hypothetical protein